ncbi:MAG: AhpC/TSA family protein [Cellvibrionaceae bacterium]
MLFYINALKVKKNTFALLKSLILLTVSLFIINVTNADEKIKLPSKEFKASLATTSKENLGKSDKGIGLTKGQTFKSFTINSHNGNQVKSAELLKQAPLLVVFYRGGWCPYCNVQIRQLTEAYPEFKKRNVTPVLISVDETDGASLAQNTYEIPFTVLSDPDLLAHKAFKVTMKIDNKSVAQYKEYGIDLEAWSKRDHHTIAVSSAFLVNKEGKILWAHASKDYKTRPSPVQLLKVIDSTLKK